MGVSLKPKTSPVTIQRTEFMSSVEMTHLTPRCPLAMSIPTGGHNQYQEDYNSQGNKQYFPFAGQDSEPRGRRHSILIICLLLQTF